MSFDEVLEQVRELVQSKGRVAYRALKRRFELDDEYLEDLKAELIEAEQVARDENGTVLVWVGSLASSVPRLASERSKRTSEVPTLDPRPNDPPRPNVSERRQITVLFCDLVGSTALSTQLDPEDYQSLVQTYHQTCADVIRRHEGYVAQPLGDGVLVYFGYPTAHEDDARRAIRTGLEIIEAVRTIPLPLGATVLFSPSPFQGEGNASSASAGEGCGKNFAQDSPHPHLLPVGAKGLQVRIGVHTGLVVVGEIGSSEKREMLALGETPNLAARIQGLAEPNTILMSAATQRLVDQQFESQPFGSHLLKGFAMPIAVYHVQSERHGVSPLTGRETLTPLVGREQEVGLLLDRWEQTKEGRGQVLLLSGEPGIGKSRLTLTLKDQVTQDGSLLYEARCSPYHQHSALYPLIEVLQRTLLFTRQDTDEQKVAKLAQVLTLYDMPDTLPLFTALLSLPTPAQYPPLNLTPQKQKERTFQALLQLMAAQAERMLHIAQHTQDAGMLLQAHMSLGVNRCMLGEFSVAQNHLEKAMSLHKPQLHWSLVSQYGYDPTMLSLTYTGITLWFLGRWDQAQEKSAEALTFARDLLHPMSLGGTFLFILWFYCLSRKEQNASTLVEESLSLAKEYNLDFLLAVCPIFKGRILLYQGKAEEGLQIIQETLSLLDTFRTQMYRSEYLSYLAQGYAAVGRIDDGLATLDQALAFVEKHDERYYEAELYRLKGELTLQQENQKSKGKEQKAKVENDAQAEAESCFRKAIDVAQQQQAKSWELRASTSLARLWQSQGKQAEAHKLLSEVYNWFTEGFDTKDLQEAKALLGELA